MENACIKDIILSKNETRLEILLKNEQEKCKVFNCFININIDIITQNPSNTDNMQRFFINIKDFDLKIVKEKLQDLNIEFKIIENLVKISITGVGIKTNTKVLYNIISTLNKNNIEILTISTSEIKISMLIKENQGEEAIFLLNKLLK